MTKSFDDLLRDMLRRPASVSSTDQCLTAESIAAWFDETLSDEERTTAEAHLASCVRCQAMLAAMARTAPAPHARTEWHSVIRWLAPLTVAAAAVLVWLNVPESSVVAPNAAVPPAAVTLESPVRQQAPASQSAQQQLASPSASVRRERAAARTSETRTPVAKASEQEVDRLSVDNTGPGASGPAAAAAPAAPPRPAATARSAADALARTETVTVAEAKPLTAQARSGVSREMFDSQTADIRWRVAAGNIERSTTGGSTWEVQATGAAGPFTTVASPSQSVCWAVGRAGAVLITTDGRSWQRVAFPELVDLVAIAASDDQTATVTTIDGRVYTTANRGRTWQR